MCVRCKHKGFLFGNNFQWAILLHGKEETIQLRTEGRAG